MTPVEHLSRVQTSIGSLEMLIWRRKHIYGASAPELEIVLNLLIHKEVKTDVSVGEIFTYHRYLDTDYSKFVFGLDGGASSKKSKRNWLSLSSGTHLPIRKISCSVIAKTMLFK